MNFLNDFEGRISSVFGSAPQGYTEPFSFKKLAKRAAREMESETYEIDGVDTAPALYTVLVASADDSLMRPLYEQITAETSAFVTAEAKKKGYSFVGEPLVRFMVDPSLKSGKFAVFAENIDARTLARLREEERAFLTASSSVGGAAALQSFPEPAAAAPQPAYAESAYASQPVAQQPAVQQPSAFASNAQSFGNSLDGLGDGLDVMPADYQSSYAAPMPVASASESTPMPVAGVADLGVAAQPAAIQVPMTQRRNVPLVDPNRGVGMGAIAAGSAAGAAAQQQVVQTPAPAAPLGQPAYAAAHAAHAAAPAAAPATQQPAAPAVATCLLIDRQTGRTFTGEAPTTVIGRERAQAGIVLRDPNVSRRHAELSYDGRDWHIMDLNSTNGTLVNDVDITECVLRDGDLITIGLVNLEFRENR